MVRGMIVVPDGYNFIILGGVEVLVEVEAVVVVVLLLEVEVVILVVLLVVGRERIIIWGPREVEVEVAMDRVVAVMVGGRVDHHLRNGCHPCIINSSQTTRQ